MKTGIRTGVVAVAALAVLASGGCDAALVGGAGSAPAAGSQGTVTIAVYPWVGYDANVAVVSRILTTKLGYRVETKKVKAAESWPAMEAGSVDVVLENWGHAAEKKTYIDEKKVAVDLGPSGNKGVISWYVPMWMAQEYPDIRDWRNLNKYAHLFKSADSGGRGRLLDGDTSYITNDQALIDNLRLNFTVTYSGSEEATVKAALEASTNHTPLLFYFWQPHWLFQQQKFAKIYLPAYKAGCDADPAKVACDYPVDTLGKIASRKFADRGGKAYEFLKNFQWSNNDQNQVAGYINHDHLSPDAAAQKWMDDNEEIWRSWLAG